jgi:hypothetical protein
MAHKMPFSAPAAIEGFSASASSLWIMLMPSGNSAFPSFEAYLLRGVDMPNRSVTGANMKDDVYGFSEQVRSVHQRRVVPAPAH